MTLIEILIAFTVADFVSGMIASGATGELKSKIGYKGIAKKVMLFILVGISVLLDTAMETDTAIQGAVIMFFLANELLSIFENAGKLGIPLPDVLVNMVAILKNNKK